MNNPIDHSVDNPGDGCARKDELRYIVTFAWDYATIARNEDGRHKLLRMINSINPEFPIAEVQEVIDELEKDGCIHFEHEHKTPNEQE